MQILTKIFSDFILPRMGLTCDNRCLEKISTEFYIFLKKIIFFTNMSFAHNLNPIFFFKSKILFEIFCGVTNI
jgi:hypothetical protein